MGVEILLYDGFIMKGMAGSILKTIEKHTRAADLPMFKQIIIKWYLVRVESGGVVSPEDAVHVRTILGEVFGSKTGYVDFSMGLLRDCNLKVTPPEYIEPPLEPDELEEIRADEKRIVDRVAGIPEEVEEEETPKRTATPEIYLGSVLDRLEFNDSDFYAAGIVNQALRDIQPDGVRWKTPEFNKIWKHSDDLSNQQVKEATRLY